MANYRTIRAGLVFALLLFALTTPVQAGTIIIVDGTDPPSGGTYTDGWIQDELVSGPVIIDTNGVGTGPDDLRVEASAVVSWTSEFSLTFRADNDVVISGTVSHDGPVDGSGGLYMAADMDGSGSGSVIVGTGNQSAGVVAGSRHGQTVVTGTDLLIQSSNVGSSYAQLGWRPTLPSTSNTATGGISVSVESDIVVSATNVVTSYAQLGHGGYNTAGNFAGDQSVTAGESIVISGTPGGGLAQLGNGGYGSTGNHGGNLNVNAGANLIVRVAMLGNGGLFSNGDHSGNHTIESGGVISFENSFAGNIGYEATGSQSGNHTFVAGTDLAVDRALVGNGGPRAAGSHSGNHIYNAGQHLLVRNALLGNGGEEASGDHSGDHSYVAGGDITIRTDTGVARLGNGYINAGGNHSGNHSIVAGGDVIVESGNGPYSCVYLGNGSVFAVGNYSGTVTLNADGSLSLRGGSGLYSCVQIGNGAASSGGNRSGDVDLTVDGDVLLEADNGGDNTYVLMGHGGVGGNGVYSGAVTLDVAGNVVFRAGDNFGIVQLGHGDAANGDARSGDVNLNTGGDLSLLSNPTASAHIGHSASSNTRGDIRVRADGSAVISRSVVGHLSSTVSPVAEGNTFVGIGQANPATSSAVLVATSGAQFSSAPATNQGELRFYAPAAANVNIVTGVLLNGVTFPGTIPPDRIQGFAPFGEGPYSPPYSFYVDDESPDLYLPTVFK